MFKPKTNNSCAFYSRSRVYCFESATQEAIWLYQLLNYLKIDTKGSIEIMEDNQRTITMVKSSLGHKRTKHIDIKHHFIRETVLTGKNNSIILPNS